tara:strand:- start:801 stop:983 length:183 start_codon:yes stop_codon:yes gene_type:complete
MTRKQFEAKYRNAWAKLVKSGQYTPEGQQALKTLSALYDLNPEWADDAEDQRIDDARMNG